MAALPLFEQVIQGLSQDQNLSRIKKLLVYVCRHSWESNPERLSHFDIYELVQELLQIAPTLDQLKNHLNKIVQTLNKPAEYALVANAIANYLQVLYQDQPEITQVVSDQSNYTEITCLLETDPEQLRIKKLLFCACNSTWENDPAKLNSFSSINLVQQLHEVTPNLESLQAVLYSIVRTLNRQQEYTLIANRILDAFKPLYGDDIIEQTKILEIPIPPSLSDTPNVQTDIQLLPSQVDSDQNPPPQKRMVDPFDLRLEIMKYTSPLRAKALLFSVLYQAIDLTPNNESLLRSHILDDLIQTLIKTYPTFTDLESSLRNTAQNLYETAQYTQAAGAILQAVKPLYTGAAQLKTQMQYTNKKHEPSNHAKPYANPNPVNFSIGSGTNGSDCSNSPLPSPEPAYSLISSSSGEAAELDWDENHTGPL